MVRILTTPRLKMLSGPMFRCNGAGTCYKTPGHYHGVGGPGAGPRAISGVVIDATTFRVTFSECVSHPSTTGVEYNIDGGTWTAVTSVLKVSDTVWEYTVTTPTIDPGDVVRWRYLGGTDSILDCDDVTDIGAQEIPVQNPLAGPGEFVLLENGESVLVETGDPDKVKTEASS